MTFPSIRIEGAILSGDLLAKVERDDFPGQKPADFGLPAGTKVKDEIARAWAEAQSLWAIYRRRLDNLTGVDLGTSETRNLWIVPFLGLFGYQLERPERAEVVVDKTYALSHRLPGRDGFPVHIVGPRHGDPSVPPDRSTLDVKAVAGPRMSPHALLQEYLNLTEHLYGLVTNGLSLRLLRDSSRLIKLSYVEFDLERIFTEQLFADFAILFRLLHVSRLPASREHAAQCLLERYHQDALESGARIRDGLRDAVEKAIVALGNGFFAHRENDALRSALQAGTLSAKDYYAHLLRLIYRLLFLMVIEERGLAYPRTADRRLKSIYDQHYSMARLRRLAGHRFLADKNHSDLWLALRATFRLFEGDEHAAKLGLSPLAGRLFGSEALGPLNAAQLDNATLLGCLRELSLFEQPGTHQVIRVNYGAIATEEFGSVYESLLELHPTVAPGTPPHFAFKQAAGNERKTTGSYYTPSSLVECLLDSALDPVLEDRLKNFAKVGYKSADEAVLALKVCDPACGSGHFLIAAAQRIARRLAVLRAGDEEPSLELLRHTLREVISHCIYGVDINPMSVELCKVGLWLEAMEAGKPLSFLDHHIRCGNSLLGATPALIAEGIPDDAFTAIEGDDKKACAALKKLNARERRGFGELFALEDSATSERLQQAAVAVEKLPDDSVRAVENKSAAFEQLQHHYDFQKATDLANLWCAAFVIRKRMADELPSGVGDVPSALSDSSAPAAPSHAQGGLFGETFAAPAGKPKKAAKPAAAASSLAEATGITSGHLRAFAKGAGLANGLMKEVRRLADQYHFFHWHLAFPEVFRRSPFQPTQRSEVGEGRREVGGFDVILGNPPWDRVKLQEKEWFAELRPDIADAPNSSARKRLIDALSTEMPELLDQFRQAIRRSEGESHLLRNTGLYPLCGRGDINVFAVFAENMRRRLNPTGRIGCVLPSGIATADTTKCFFQDLVQKRSLVSFFSFFEIREIFIDTDSRDPFCLLTAGSGLQPLVEAAEFVFGARSVDQVCDRSRRFTLTAEDIALINPNTRTCPIFHTGRDADITKAICRRVNALVDESSEQNPWGVFYLRLVDMGDHAEEIRSEEQILSHAKILDRHFLDTEHGRFLPLYEGKLVTHFDHRFATFAGVSQEDAYAGFAREVQPQEHVKAEFSIYPRYWVSESFFDGLLAKYAYGRGWFIGFRDVCRSGDERTCIAAVIPRLPATRKFPTIGIARFDFGLCLASCLQSFALDYVARQKLGGTSMSFFIFKQLPVPLPGRFGESCPWSGSTETLKDWLLPRVLELTYTAWDLEAFAQDCGWSGPPFRWDEERRFQLRCELDAAFFHLYGLDRADTAYILDTFPIVKRKDEERHGHYRTKDRILALYDALAECQRTGQAFVSPLKPTPASLGAAHPWGWEDKPLELPSTPRVPLPERWQYVVTVLRELVWQAGGSIPWRILRDATDLLADRARLARLAKADFGPIADQWLALDGDLFDLAERWDQLSGLCFAGKLRVVRQGEELVVELLSVEGHLFFPHVRFDARLVLAVARSLPVVPATASAVAESQKLATLVAS